MNETRYYILKRGLYFRPEARGYTEYRYQAGIFTKTSMGSYWDDEELEKRIVDVEAHNYEIEYRIRELKYNLIKQ